MSLVILVSLLVAVLGLVLYIVAYGRPGKWAVAAEVGRLAFATGLLACLLQVGGKALHF